MARVEHIKEEQRSSNDMEQISSLFNTLNTAWRKTSDKFEAGRKVDVGKEDKTSQSEETALSTEVKGIESINSTNFVIYLLKLAFHTDQSEGRYIKGDPLKGYYDFIITEGSYKFWAAFQVN